MNADNNALRHSRVRGWFENSAKLYEARIRDLSLLRRLSDSISLDLNVEEAARFILDIMIDELNVCNGSIMFLEEETRTLSLLMARGHHRQSGGERIVSGSAITLDVGEGVAGTVLETGVPILIPDVEADDRFSIQKNQVVKVGSLICLPLWARGETIGVLNLSHENRFAFSESDLNGLTVAANQIAMLLDNADNYQRLCKANTELETRLMEGTVKIEQTAEALEQTRSSLVQAERLSALGQMASGVAHDFNNTLAGIIGNVQIMLGQVSDPALRDRLQSVELAALDGAATIKRIQEFSRVNRDADFEPLRVNDLITDTLKITSPIWKDQAQKRGVSIDITTHLSEVANVEGNAPELREVLTNMLINAVEAMPEGGNIELSTWTEGERTFLSIKDDGEGISDSIRARLFDPFFSSKGPTNSGLGLSVAYGIVCRHEGNIEVVSTPGSGTTFILDFPTTEAEVAQQEATAGETASSKARILVIDDDDSVRNVLVTMLTHLGHEVEFANDGQSGLEVLKTGPFSMVLTDLGMPGMSGWDVAAGVKSLQPGTPVVLITGWGREISPSEAKQKQVDFVLPKPFQLSSIKAMVEEVQASRD